MKDALGKAVAAFAFCAIGLTLSSCSFEAPKITAPRYALVVGVTNYQHATNLTYPVDDAFSIANLLSSQGWSTTLAQDSTRSSIVDAIAAMTSGIESNSTFLFYFSGHGDLLNDNTTAIIAPSDANFITVNSKLVIDPSTVISASQLSLMLSMLPTKNVIVILDTCFSGGFVSSTGAIDGSPTNYNNMASYSAFGTAISNFGKLLVKNASASGEKTPIVISAAGSREESFETGLLSHGVFTYYLLQAATKGDSDNDGVVTTTEAYTYATQGVKSWDSLYGYGTAFLPHISGDTRDLVLFSN